MQNLKVQSVTKCEKFRVNSSLFFKTNFVVNSNGNKLYIFSWGNEYSSLSKDQKAHWINATRHALFSSSINEGKLVYIAVNSNFPIFSCQFHILL